jgi:hypothetical protein
MKINLLTYLILSIFSIKVESLTNLNHLRNLQAESTKSNSLFSKSLYYTPQFEKFNNFTGTGNQLRDEAYRAICFSMNCQYECCEGDTNKMSCGDFKDCQVYKTYATSYVIYIIAFCSFIVVYIVVFCVIREIYKDYTTLECLGYATLIMIVIVALPFLVMFGAFKDCNSTSCDCNIGVKANKKRQTY